MSYGQLFLVSQQDIEGLYSRSHDQTPTYNLMSTLSMILTAAHLTWVWGLGFLLEV